MTNASSCRAGAGLAVLALACAVGLGSVAFAASGGGSQSTKPTCEAGYIYDESTKSCVKVESRRDDELYQAGRDLALAGRYDEALEALMAVRDRSDSMVLTMIGYAKRKQGNIDEGMAYYRQALAIDPNNADTREYLGEAYAERGQLDLARAELAKVEALCGTECEQYEDLAAAIAGNPVE